MPNITKLQLSEELYNIVYDDTAILNRLDNIENSISNINNSLTGVIYWNRFGQYHPDNYPYTKRIKYSGNVEEWTALLNITHNGGAKSVMFFLQNTMISTITPPSYSNEINITRVSDDNDEYDLNILSNSWPYFSIYIWSPYAKYFSVS